jgi:mannose-6-phosphate isomerase
LDWQSSPPALAPFRVDPIFDERVWGFRDLHPWFDHIAEREPIGEAWLTGDDCLVATGPHAGKKLGDLFHEVHASLLGADSPQTESPLLIKVLFARDKLSVQVHPDDAMAHKYGQPRGKTECWYALAAEPGAKVAVGLKPGVTLRQVEEEIHAGTLEASLNMVPVSAGEMIFMDAGTVHAIWPGSILLETQQNCDLTYRMYDYGRGRELHIEKALEAVHLKTRAGKITPKAIKDRTVLIDEKYFRIERVPVNGTRTSTSLHGAGLSGESQTRSGLAYLFAAAGSARITGTGMESVELPTRGVVAVAAISPEFEVQNLGGLDLIRITPGQP